MEFVMSGCEGWRQTTLGELCNDDVRAIQTGPFGSQLHASDYIVAGVPVVNPTHLRVNSIDEEHLPFISKEMADELSRHYLREGDILVSRRGDFSRYSYIGAKQSGWLCGTGCLRIRLRNPSIDNRFLAAAFSLTSVQSYLSQAAVGSIMPNLNTNILRDIPLAIPPVAQQRAIAELLGRISTVMDTWNQELDLERERKAALMEYLFTHGTRGEKRKETEIGEIPESWRVVELIDAVNKIDYGISAPIPHDPPPGGVRIVSTADITKDGRLLYSQIRTIAAPERTVKRLTLRTGDVLFNWRNSAELIGKTAVFREQPLLHVFASFILRIECDERRTHNFFLSLLLNHWREKGVFMRLSRRAVNQANYNRNEISALKIPLPPYEEQREIARVLLACDNVISAASGENSVLDELFRTMLEELMSGRLSAAPLIEEHQPQ